MRYHLFKPLALLIFLALATTTMARKPAAEALKTYNTRELEAAINNPSEVRPIEKTEDQKKETNKKRENYRAPAIVGPPEYAPVSSTGPSIGQIIMLLAVVSLPIATWILISKKPREKEDPSFLNEHYDNIVSIDSQRRKTEAEDFKKAS